MKIQGKQSGKGLKPGLNYADTGSVVETMKTTVSFGKSTACNGPGGKSSNNMKAANASKK